ncbi:MAG: DUF1489 domain-containing protein [Alphaproteobacteria bacterium]|nr:DUF1489 domain-containing protein [Alphaproteobacteria bacterium]
MPLHLKKLCVGVERVDELAAYQDRRRRELKAAGLPPYNRHVTRNTPRRMAEILDGSGEGSLFWVIKREIKVRQRLHAIEPVTDREGRPCCALVLEPDLIRVVPVPHRPFQGWRYLDSADAPSDLPQGAVDETGEMPEEMRRELRALGLL